MRIKTVIAAVLIMLVPLIGSAAAAKTEVDLVWSMKNGVNELTTSAEIGLSDSLVLQLGIRTQGKMENNEQQVFSADRFGLTYQGEHITVFGGAVPRSIGQARIHQIFLRESGPAFSNLGYRFSREAVSYTKFFGDLSQDEGYKRLGVHYLNWRPIPNLSLGIGEAFVVSQPFKGDTYYYFVPILPYYVAKYFPGIATSIDNAFFYGDGELRLGPLALYGELLVNEFPMSPFDHNPKLYAITLGLESEFPASGWNLLAEFSHVTDQAYSNGRPQNVFTYGDLSLGHALGDDLTAADLQLSKYFGTLETTAEVGVYYLKLGSTDPAPWIGQEEPVITEQIYGVKLGLERQFDQFRLAFDLELGYIRNDGHQADATGYRTTAVLTGSWRLP